MTLLPVMALLEYDMMIENKGIYISARPGPGCGPTRRRSRCTGGASRRRARRTGSCSGRRRRSARCSGGGTIYDLLLTVVVYLSHLVLPELAALGRLLGRLGRVVIINSSVVWYFLLLSLITSSSSRACRVWPASRATRTRRHY